MNTFSRRHFLLLSSGAVAGTVISPGIAESNDEEQSFIAKSGLNTGQPRPLTYQSIPGFLSAEQLTPHFSAHYSGALRGYLAAEEKLQSSITEGSALNSTTYGALQVARTSKENSVLLHELYFEGIVGVPGNMAPELRNALEKRFGSVEKWALDFQASAKAASGWALLVFHPVNGKLYNVVSDKHATGVLWMATPLIVIDVYEHAFYVDYKNRKTEYIEKFIKHINWLEVNRRYKAVSSNMA